MTSGKELLVAMINRDNPHITPLTVDDVTFGLPTPEAGLSWDTKITATAAPNKALSGTIDLHYTRGILASFGSSLVVQSQHAFTKATFLRALNGTRRVPVTLDDLLPFTLPTLSSGLESPLTIAARPESLIWQGALTLMLKITSVSLTEVFQLLAGKQDLAEKAVDFNIVNDTVYPSVKAVKAYVDDAVQNVQPGPGNGNPGGSIDGGFY
jgi:hypothetical protein